MEWRDNRLRLPDGRWLGYGECGDPAGRPIVYCHGGISSRLDIAFAGPACEGLGVRLLAVDRPGLGLSDLGGRGGLLDWPDDVTLLADSLGLDRFEVLGWSLGGAYALACGYRLRERVTRVATVGSVAPLAFPGAIDCLGAWLDRVLLRWGPRIPGLSVTLLWLTSWVPPGLLKRLVLRELGAADRRVVAPLSVPQATDFIQEAFRTGVRGAAADYHRVARGWGFALEQLKMPVDVYWGDEDLLCPREHTDYLVRHLTHGRLHVLPGRGHFLLHQDLPAVIGGVPGAHGHE